MKPEPLLSVSDLDVTYGEAQALFGVSVEVAPGAAVAVLGPNGAGKSSLAGAIAGGSAPRPVGSGWADVTSPDGPRTG